VSCTTADQIQAFLTQCRSPGHHHLYPARRPATRPDFTRRRSTVVAMSSSSSPVAKSTSTPVVLGGGGGGPARVDSSGSGSLADRLRLGSLLEDGLSYKEKFIVRCYEVGINKTATVETIANLLQEVGCNHAQSVGFSTDGFATTPTMRKLHLIWVTARMHIEIYKYPAWSDVLEIETWCQGEGRIGTRRDWILKDYATGEVIGRATSFLSCTSIVRVCCRFAHFLLVVLHCESLPFILSCFSKWVMMNQDTRRLQKVSDDVRDEYLVFCPREPRLSFPEPNNRSLKKIAKLEDPAQYSKLGLVSVPQDVIDTHELQTITLDYRRECQHDDVVDSLTSVEPGEDAEVESKLHVTNGRATATADNQDSRNFLHLLRLSGDGLEINRGRTEWRRKPARNV
ncbi:hypothetical protein Tsubulata_010506, partial [Turnera subulata]